MSNGIEIAQEIVKNPGSAVGKVAHIKLTKPYVTTREREWEEQLCGEQLWTKVQTVWLDPNSDPRRLMLILEWQGAKISFVDGSTATFKLGDKDYRMSCEITLQ